MNGVELIDATVTGVKINAGGNGDGLHTVTIQDPAGAKQTLTARWLVDATGRNRVLQKHLQLQEKVVEQKDVFWFRLANFNHEILSHIQAIKTPNRCYVPYYATHHFFGKGNWIWYIPMRSPEYDSLVSIGITYRKDVYPHGEVRTMEQFLECVGREHPVLVELINTRHGRRHELLELLYVECRRRYSAVSWHISGVASDTVHLLYSVGLALSTLQNRQITRHHPERLNGFDTKEFTKDLDIVITNFQRGVTLDTTRLYAIHEAMLIVAISACIWR